MLKKLSAIVLLALFLFNLIGYKALFYYAILQSDYKVETSIENNTYNHGELITLHIPLSLPYIENSPNFERVNGEINFNGKLYKYVQRKIENGELVLLCLPDANKMQLENSKNDYFKGTFDLQQNNAAKKTPQQVAVFKNVLSEFEKVNNQFQVYCAENYLQLSPEKNSSCFSVTLPAPEKPPEYMAG